MAGELIVSEVSLAGRAAEKVPEKVDHPEIVVIHPVQIAFGMMGAYEFLENYTLNRVFVKEWVLDLEQGVMFNAKNVEAYDIGGMTKPTAFKMLDPDNPRAFVAGPLSAVMRGSLSPVAMSQHTLSYGRGLFRVPIPGPVLQDLRRRLTGPQKFLEESRDR